MYSLRLLVPRRPPQGWEEAALRPHSPPLAGTSTGSVLVFDVPSKGTNITLSEVLEQHSSPITDIGAELCEQPVRPEGASLSPPPDSLWAASLVIFKLPRGKQRPALWPSCVAVWVLLAARQPFRPAFERPQVTEGSPVSPVAGGSCGSGDGRRLRSVVRLGVWRDIQADHQNSSF